jgi:hypothetical protein
MNQLSGEVSFFESLLQLGDIGEYLIEFMLLVGYLAVDFTQL